MGEWMKELGEFGPEAVEKFIESHNTGHPSSRISSWSKLLAFADSKKYAIYDARTSVALNCALQNLGDTRRFYMPDGQNKLIKAAQRCLSSGIRQPRLKYIEYMEILNAVIKHQLSQSILDAEMTIFANSERLASKLFWGQL